MIDVKAKVHDKFSLEFKVGFIVKESVKDSNFVINTWLFVPNSLDINPMTYPKNDFYRDVKSNIRLITPIFLLRDMVSGSAVPFKNLEKAFNTTVEAPTIANVRMCESQIKMFGAIFKSAMREELLHIFNNFQQQEDEYLIRAYIESVRNITTKYRELRRVVNVPTVPTAILDYHQFGDEYISHLADQESSRLLLFLKHKNKQSYRNLIAELSDFIRSEIAYKQSKGYLSITPKDQKNNRELIFRQSVLKKYIESDLYLQARKKKDGVLVEQIYYSLAAGISMVFATGIAFSFQMRFGNFTMPLFVALVVSYMLKDRIKELMRYYFAHRLGENYFDNKTHISINDNRIGVIKEGVDFISDSKVPGRVMEIRNRSRLVEAENRTQDEKILLYRKHVKIDREKIESGGSGYHTVGVNDIMRLHVNQYVQKMDNPEEPLRMLNRDSSVSIVYGKRVYYLNIVMQLLFEDKIDYKRFRVVFNRHGIIKLEELQ